MGRRLPSNGGTVKPGERGSRRSLLAMFFYLGLGVKRWLLIAGLGIGVWSVGASFVIKNLFDLSVPNVLPWFLEGVLIGLGGLFLLLVSAYGLYRSVGPLLLASTSIDSVAETIDQEVHGLVDTAYQRAKEIIGTNKDKLANLAKYLIDNETAERDVLEMLFSPAAPAD